MSTLIQINSLSKAYGTQVIFDEATFSVSEGQKIGVIGRNGAGKSTLFQMIVGAEEVDHGDAIVHKHAHLGYLKQHDPFSLNETIMEFLLRDSGKEAWQCAKIAGKFQLKGDILQSRIGTLSGGYQMRVKLSAMLLHDPNMLLLDEPTNYLDLRTLLLLEEFLRSYHGAFLIISHDREFLKNTCEQTLEVDHGKLMFFPRPLEEYLTYKEEQLEMVRRYNKKIEREAEHLQTFVDRFRYKASKATQAQSKLKQIARLKTIEIEHPMSSVRMRIPAVDHRHGLALRTSELAIGYPEKTIAQNITLDIERGERIAILGDNGQGKTTLLKTLAGALEPLGGTMRWMPHTELGYYAQHVPSMLNPAEQIYPYLERVAASGTKRETILEMAGNFLFRGDDVKKSISILSGGEKARLCLAGLLLGKKSVLLLDEPTNHLDAETVEALGIALRDYTGTILFVSHNRTFAKLVATSIIEVQHGEVKRYAHNYEEYVYHLQQTLGIDLNEKQATPTSDTEKPTLSDEEKKLLHEEIKQKKKDLRHIEHTLADYEKEKNTILHAFEKRPTHYDPEKTRRLRDITALIEEEEGRWLNLQNEIEKLP